MDCLWQTRLWLLAAYRRVRMSSAEALGTWRSSLESALQSHFLSVIDWPQLTDFLLLLEFANSRHELRAPAPMKCDRFGTKAGFEVDDPWCSEPAQQSDPDTCKHHSLSLPSSWEARKSEFDSSVSTPAAFSFHTGGTYGSDSSLLCWTRCA